MAPDRCHVCDEPIRPGQDARECANCGRVGHESCGQWDRSLQGESIWYCDECLDV